jgi:MFS family permease
VSPRLNAAFVRTFSSVRESRNFRLYLTGQTISAIGMWMNFTASAWLVLQLTNSGTALGTNVALYFLPVLLLGAYGGVLADRFDKRRILMATQCAYGIVAAALFTLVFTDAAQLWMVYLLSVASGIVTAVDNPSRQSFYVEMVGESNVRNAVSLNSAAFTGSRVIGPAVAGVLIATRGIATCFLIDAISYIAVLIALSLMRTGELHPQARSTRDRGHLVAGLKYVWRTDDLRRPLIAMAVVFTFAFNFAVFVPLLAKVTFGGDAGTFGALSALAGVGSFIGAITMASRVAEPRLRGLAWWAVAMGVALVLPGLAPTLPVAAVTMIPMGFALMAFMITGNTMLQLTSRPEARGRVMALYGIVFLGSTPIGAPIAGVIGEHLGARVGFILSGAVAAGLGLTLLAIGRTHSDRLDVREGDGAEPFAAPAIPAR